MARKIKKVKKIRRQRMPRLNGLVQLKNADNIRDTLHDLNDDNIRLNAWCKRHGYVRNWLVSVPDTFTTGKITDVITYCPKCLALAEQTKFKYSGHRVRLRARLSLEVLPMPKRV